MGVYLLLVILHSISQKYVQEIAHDRNRNVLFKLEQIPLKQARRFYGQNSQDFDTFTFGLAQIINARLRLGIGTVVVVASNFLNRIRIHLFRHVSVVKELNY